MYGVDSKPGKRPVFLDDVISWNCCVFDSPHHAGCNFHSFLGHAALVYCYYCVAHTFIRCIIENPSAVTFWSCKQLRLLHLKLSRILLPTTWLARSKKYYILQHDMRLQRDSNPHATTSSSATHSKASHPRVPKAGLKRGKALYVEELGHGVTQARL